MRNRLLVAIAAIILLSGFAFGKDKSYISDLKLTDGQETVGLKIYTITRGFDDYFYLKNICTVLKIDFAYSTKQKKVTLLKASRSFSVFVNNSNKLLPETPIMFEKRLYVSRNGMEVILGKLFNSKVEYKPGTREFNLGNAGVIPAPQKFTAAPVPSKRIESRPEQENSKKVVAEKKGEQFKVKRIVLDAGHGGKDPGAIGFAGLYEKEVTFDIAVKLEKEIREKLGREVVMTRSSDKFVSLPERCYSANSKNGDIFISIHMNANSKSNISGMEVYIYGREGSDMDSRKLALRENLDSPSLYDKAINRILGEIGKKSNENMSILLAGFVEDELVGKTETVGRYNKGILRAPFYVLTNTEMPSILIEAAFITNPEEERKLRSEEFRNKIVEGIFLGIEKFIAATEVEEVAKSAATDKEK
ncbi:MAG: N-acetylmuramoyl-L-alanine amidase [Candidatus Firestonebacteria bacterium]